MEPLSARLSRQLGGPRDGALLRLSIGSALHDEGRIAEAIGFLRAAVELDPAYSAAWKRLGLALDAQGECNAALEAWTQGIAAAEARGDVQAAKEMQVFRRRTQKAMAP